MSFSNLKIHPSWNVYVRYMEEDFLPEWLETLDTFTYKCKWGRTCTDKYCEYIHPGQAGYSSSPYYESNVPCRYETESTSCKLKCASSVGVYCPFSHCKHTSHEHLSFLCAKPDCQRHCPKCI